MVWPICTFLLSCCKDFTSIRHVQTIYYYNQPTSHWGSCQAGCYTQNPNHFKKIFLPEALPLDSQPNMRLVVVLRQEFATRSELAPSGEGMEGRGRGTDIRSHLVFAFGFFSPSRGGCWKVLVLAEPSCLARLEGADRPRTYLVRSRPSVEVIWARRSKGRGETGSVGRLRQLNRAASSPRFSQARLWRDSRAMGYLGQTSRGLGYGSGTRRNTGPRLSQVLLGRRTFSFYFLCKKGREKEFFGLKGGRDSETANTRCSLE